MDQVLNRQISPRFFQQLVATMKKSVASLKSKRKKTADGVELKMFKLLKTVYKVKIQAYHGGSLTSKDITKVMSSAHEIFPKLAGIFEEGKKEGGMSKENIDKLCEDTC